VANKFEDIKKKEFLELVSIFQCSKRHLEFSRHFEKKSTFYFFQKKASIKIFHSSFNVFKPDTCCFNVFQSNNRYLKSEKWTKTCPLRGFNTNRTNPPG
jgi:hypothetical protein